MNRFRSLCALLILATLATGLTGCFLKHGSGGAGGSAASSSSGATGDGSQGGSASGSPASGSKGSSSGAGSAAGGTTSSAQAAAAPMSSGLDPQTDAGAGKEVDMTAIAKSPKKGSPYLGPDTPIVIVNVFSDFQCPVCRRSADPIKQLVVDFPGQVKVVFRNNALEMHGRSKPAALAAAAAGKQGQFWPYYDRLFADQAQLDDASLKQDAQTLGLNLPKWETDIADPKLAERIKTESDWAVKLGAAGTPAFFVNGVRQVGWGSYQGLKSMVDREIKSSQELEAAGTPRAKIPAERIRATADKNQNQGSQPPIVPDEWVTVLMAD
jgi:protein-disulfide isomerase